MTYDDDDTRSMWFANWHAEEVYQFVRSESIYTEQTEIQRLEVIETESYGRVMLQDGELQIATTGDAAVHEAMCHPPMVVHDDPAEVLIVGGGDGASTREVLKHDPDHVDVVEIDDRVIDVAKEYFPEFARDFDDPRVAVHNMDGRRFVREGERTYDIVIMDISDPQGPAKTVFTSDFYRELKPRLTDTSVLHTHCESPDVARDDFYRILATLEEHFEHVDPYRHWVPAYVDFWGRAVASDAHSAYELSVAEIANRLDARGVSLEWLTPELCHAMFRSLNKEVIGRLSEDWPVLRDDEYHEW